MPKSIDRKLKKDRQAAFVAAIVGSGLSRSELGKKVDSKNPQKGCRQVYNAYSGSALLSLDLATRAAKVLGKKPMDLIVRLGEDESLESGDGTSVNSPSQRNLLTELISIQGISAMEIAEKADPAAADHGELAEAIVNAQAGIKDLPPAMFRKICEEFKVGVSGREKKRGRKPSWKKAKVNRSSKKELKRKMGKRGRHKVTGNTGRKILARIPLRSTVWSDFLDNAVVEVVDDGVVFVAELRVGIDPRTAVSLLAAHFGTQE